MTKIDFLFRLVWKKKFKLKFIYTVIVLNYFYVSYKHIGSKLDHF